MSAPFGNVVPQGVTLDALHLIVRMLDPNPDKRITTNEAIEHPYFNDVYFDHDTGIVMQKQKQQRYATELSSAISTSASASSSSTEPNPEAQ